MFDVFYLGKNDKLKELVPFAKEIQDVEGIKPRTKMYWLIEPNIEILDADILSYRPPEYDQIFEHVWKWDPKNYGGVKLLPTANSQGVKQLNHIVCKKTFDILYTNTPQKYFDNHPYASHVWCVDSEYVLNDDINWAPDMFEPDFIHSFHLRGQLEHKYPELEGGVKLYPRDWKQCEVKFHGFLDNIIKFPHMYVDDVTDYSQRDTLEDEFVWLIDREHKINEDSLDWAPNPFEANYIHVFRMPYQLQQKYPQAMGGIRLVPKNWRDTGDKIYKDCPVEDINYDVFFTNKDFTADTFAYYAERSKTEWFWVVDWDYDFNGKLLYVPAEHESEYIHVFKWGLEWRYDPSITDLWDKRVAGIYLVSKKFDYSKQKLHTTEVPVKYDVFYTDDINNYIVPSRKSRTDMFWLVDQDHILNNDFTYVPSAHDQQYIHIFKIDGQLEHKYDPDITNVSDNRAGGVKLVPAEWENADKKFINKSPMSRHHIRTFVVDEPSDYGQAPEGVVCWLIDRDYELTEEINWIPPESQENKIHIFHIQEKCKNKEKYRPGESGGIVYLPPLTLEEREQADVVLHNESPLVTAGAGFEVFTSIDEGLVHSQTEWFWVVDPNVEVLEDFSFTFVPDAWDKDKIHVWQKINPITERQYDYDGVRLVPKGLDINDTKSRPKYIRETASRQKEFPVYNVDPTSNLIIQLQNYSKTVINSHFWVVDPHTEIAPDFIFDYYPTQWDKDNVHVFQDQDGNYRNIRLYPREFFENFTEITDEDIANNSFDNLKLMNTIASMRVSWPVLHLADMDKDQFVDKIEEYHKMGYAYVWSIDSDAVVDNKVLEAGYMPSVTAVDKIHLWQRSNPATGAVHSYGGLRLWPTDRDYTTLTSSQLKLNKMKGLQYVREIGSTYRPLDVAFISYMDDDAEVKFRTLKKKYPKAKWIRDVEGIFEAHKEAAQKCRSTMFWVVDSDAELVEDFAFDYIPDVYDQETTHVWKSKNPITGGEYGYGGVKLFNRQQILDADNWGLDFTTGLSNKFKMVEEISNITRFNTDPLSTWRSAFREAVKLTLKDDDTESKERLQTWLNPTEEGALYFDYAKAGASQGHEYANKYRTKPLRLSRINDYEWLESQFNAQYPKD